MPKYNRFTEYGYVSLFVWGLLFVFYATPERGFYSSSMDMFIVFLYILTGLLTIILFEQAHKLKETQANTTGLIISVIVLVITVVGLLPFSG